MKKEEILTLLEEEVLEEGKNIIIKKGPIDIGRLGGIIDPNRLKINRK